MGDPREAILMIVTGQQGVGKSNETLRSLFLNYIRGQHARRVLIYDPNNEYGNYKIYNNDGSVLTELKVDRISPDDIVKFNSQKMIEMRRVVPFDKYNNPLSEDEQDKLLVQVSDQFRGGCLFIDDLNKVFGDSLPKRFSGLLTNTRHRNCDIILQVQSVGRLLPKIRQNAKVVRFHRQLDSVDESREKLNDRYELYKLAELVVQSQFEKGFQRFFVYLNLELNKLRGVSREMFDVATLEYLSLNANIISREANKVDILTGKKNSSWPQAVEKQKERILRQYFLT